MNRRTFSLALLSGTCLLSAGKPAIAQHSANPGALRGKIYRDYAQGRLTRLKNGWIVSDTEAQLPALKRWV